MTFNPEFESLGYLLNHTASAHRRVMSQHTKQFDITPEQYGVLFQLRSADAVSQKRLAEMMYKDQATVGKMIDKLEAKSFVRREADPADRRAFLIQMTAEGRQVVEQIMPLSSQVNEQAAAGITSEDLATFVAVINKLHANLSQ